MGRRGSPLAVLGIVMVAWIGGRAAIWENPFAALPVELPTLVADKDTTADDAQPIRSSERIPVVADASIPTFERSGGGTFALLASLTQPGPSMGMFSQSGRIAGSTPDAIEPRIAAGHQLLWRRALMHRTPARALAQPAMAQPPFAPPLSPASSQAPRLERWSLDAWAFWRQGSNATAISQGRVPIYGASQVGASLQFRLKPSSGNDPRLYARAYRALVTSGETEVAAGVSARPIARVPLRAQAELRVTDNAFQTEVRPAALVVTELAPQRLPAGFVAEVYAQGGYVGGDNATAFADGQVSLTREVATFDLASSQPARLSVGAGAWGGAQKDAQRVDLGPSVRLDLSIGKVPARLSVDWREQVAGDAAPDSGIAATLSTRF